MNYVVHSQGASSKHVEQLLCWSSEFPLRINDGKKFQGWIKLFLRHAWAETWVPSAFDGEEENISDKSKSKKILWIEVWMSGTVTSVMQVWQRFINNRGSDAGAHLNTPPPIRRLITWIYRWCVGVDTAGDATVRAELQVFTAADDREEELKSVCMFVHFCVHLCVFVHLCMCAFFSTCLCIYICACMCMWVWVRAVSIIVGKSLCVSRHLLVCFCKCVCICQKLI